jgi:predicted dehydrogenase
MEPVRLGLIGCGVIGTVHLDAALQLPEVRVVAVADLIEEKGRANGEKAGSRVYREGADLLRDPDVEAVILAFPAQHRTALARAALGAGKHVLIEKPIAMNAAEVRQIICARDERRAARGDRVAACCCSRHRFQPSAQAAAQVIAAGRLGQLRTLHGRVLWAAGPPPEAPRPEWRLKSALNGGGILMNWGCYDLDYLLGLCGWSLRPRLVLARTWPVPETFRPHVPPGSDAETHFTAFVSCEDGVALTLERSEYTAGNFGPVWQIVGDRGSLLLNLLPSEGKELWLETADPEQGVVKELIWSGDEDWLPTQTGMLQDFVGAIREGRAPAATLENALVVQQITDAIYASAREGKAVEVA